MHGICVELVSEVVLNFIIVIMSIEENLIVLVKQNPALYDLNHQDYYNVPKKEAIWKEIGAQFNQSGNGIKNKWTSLRDCYRKALNKRKRLGLFKKKIRHEAKMSFLNEYLSSPRQEHGYVSDTNLLESAAVKEEFEESQSSFDNSELFSELDASVTVQTTNPISKLIPKSTLKIQALEDESPISAMAAVLDNYFHSKNHSKTSPCNKSDHIAAFFRSAEATVRTFNSLYQVQIKAEISSLLSKYEMKNLLATNQEDEDCN